LTNEDIENLKKRCIQNLDIDMSTDPWKTAAYICPLNASRISFYISFIVADAEGRNMPIYWVKAEDIAANMPQNYMDNIQQQNAHLSDTQTGDLPLMLPLVEGHTYCYIRVA
jgi:hypothetical protein